MKLSFRWFGDSDPVNLWSIKQIPGMKNIVTQLQSAKIGEALDLNEVMRYKEEIESRGLTFEVFESLVVHPSIKLGLAERDYYIDIFKKNMVILAKAGIKVIVYNFRPLFRWARTEIYKELEDKSTASIFDRAEEEKYNPFLPQNDVETSKWHREHSHYVYKKQITTDLELEGYYTKKSREILNGLKKQYLDLGKEGIFENLNYFINEIMAVAQVNDLKMAMHPDDPPWDIFGVPRLMTNEEAMDKLLSFYDSPRNGIVFCSGTFGSNINNDVIRMADKYLKMDRIPFSHIRNVKTQEDSFEECGHYSDCGSIDMVELLKVFHKNNYTGYIRPDHGRMIWEEQGQSGNGIYDRALGAQYILGIWECLSKI